MSETLINRVYDLKIAGYDDSLKKVKSLTAAFKSMDETKRKTDEQLKKAIQLGDQKAISDLTAKVKQLEASLKDLDRQRKNSAKEVEALARAEKLEADAKLANARADRERTKSLIDQEKEIDRLIDREEKKNRKLKESTGYYYDLLKAQRAAIQAYREAQPDSPLYEQIKKQAVDAKAKVDAFNRSLSPDGTLVGEYRSGIVNAFRDLGLGDVIRNQRNDVQNQLNKLQQDARELASQYRKTGADGKEAFEKIDAAIRANFADQEKLKRNLEVLSNGGIGKQISSSIGGAFRDIKRDVAAAALAYVSFQGLASGVSTVFQNTVKLDSLNSSLLVVSGSQAVLAENNQFLKQTTEQLGLEFIGTAQAFRNFYAASTQAGISVQDTREIFLSAATAAANLKLSQEDTNGVLLAFSQIASKGKVQAEELRGQIGERVPGAFAIAARAIGVTQQQLNKMLENGQVIASEFLPKFAAELKKTFGGDTTQKVEGLQASINKMKNQLTELIVENQAGLTVVFNLIVAVATFFIGNLPLIIGLFTLWGIGWLQLNRQMIVTRTIMPVLIALFGGAEKATKAWTVATTLLTRAKQFLLRVIGSPGFGIFVGIVATLIISIKAFAGAVDQSAAKLGVMGQKQKFLAESMSEANKEVAKTIAQEKVYLSIIKDRSLQDSVREKALISLKKLMGEYGEQLTLETVLTDKGTEALKKYNEQLLKRAQVSAASAIAERENQKLTKLLQYQNDIATAIASGGEISTGQFDKDFVERYYKQQGRSASLIGQFIGDKIGIDFTYSGKDLQAFAKLVDTEIKTQLEKVKGAELAKFEIDQKNSVPGQPTGVNSVSETVFQRFARLVKNNGTEQQFEDLKKDIAEKKKNTAVISKEYRELTELEKQIEEFLNPKDKRQSSASKLTGEQKDLFKDIDAKRDEQLAIEKKKFIDLVTNEEEYLRNVYKINVDAADKKLALLKGKSAEERKVIAELKLYKVEQEQELNKKLFDLSSQQLERELDNARKQAELQFSNVNDDPTKSPVQKTEAREKYLTQLQVLQVAFNSRMDELEKQFGQQSGTNAQKRKDELINITRELNRVILQLNQERYEQELRLNEEAFQRQTNFTKQATADRIKAALQDPSLTTSERARRIRQIEFEQTKVLLAQEEAAARIALQNKEAALKKGLATETEVSDAKTKLKLAELALIKLVSDKEVGYLDRLKNKLSDAYKNITDFFKGVKKSKEESEDALNESLEATGAIIRDAITSAKEAFFNNQERQLENERRIADERLQIEENQRLNTAQSEAEKDSIRRQFEDKRKQLDKKSAEDQRELALKKIKIDFAIAVVKTLATYPFPFSLIPVAGLTIAYLLQRAAVKNQQFAKGGKVRPEDPLPSGPIRTTPNIPTQPNGDNVLATVRTGEVILNEEQQRKLGGAKTFAKIGVPGFAGGGYVGMGSFRMGENLQAPDPFTIQQWDARQAVNRSNAASNNNSFMMDAIYSNAQTIAAVNGRIDKLKVINVASETEKKNNELKRASNIGNL